MSFPLAVGLTMRWEGGRSDVPDDPGGHTFCGITQDSFCQWLRQPMESCQDVATASGEQVLGFCRDYWNRMGGPGYDGLDERLGMLMFDASYQHGNKLAVQFLQRALQIQDDGKFGPNSFQRLHLVYHDTPDALLKDVVRYRREHYMERGLRPQLTKFLAGWIRRVDDMEKVAESPIDGLTAVVKAANGGAHLPIVMTGIP